MDGRGLWRGTEEAAGADRGAVNSGTGQLRWLDGRGKDSMERERVMEETEEDEEGGDEGRAESPHGEEWIQLRETWGDQARSSCVPSTVEMSSQNARAQAQC